MTVETLCGVPLNTVLHGNTVTVLKDLREKGVKVHCVVTSPPYFQKRNYGTNPVIWDDPGNCEHEWNEHLKRLHQGGGNSGVPDEWQRPSRKDNTGGNSGRFCKKCNAWEGELGLEPTVELFVEHLCQVFDVVKDILRDDGNCFVNLDDTFKDKDMLMVPEEFARAMRKRGWILRRKIMWLKRNPMRRPDKDTFVHSWEYFYQFVKQQEYYFETQYEPYSEATIKEFEKEYNGKGHKNYAEQGIQDPSEIKRRMLKSGKNPMGAIMTDVIVTAVSHWHGSHTATFPVELITPLIQGGCPEFICKKCGKPRERIYDEMKMPTRPGEDISMDGKSRSENDPYKEIHSSTWSILKPRVVRIETGLTDCGCGQGWESGITLDPFFGTGTTGEAAIKLRRRFLGIEINEVSVKESQGRLSLLAEEFARLGDNEKFGRQASLFEKQEKQASLEGFTGQSLSEQEEGL